MKEIRTAEIRATDPAGSDALILEGTPIVFDSPAEIASPAGSYIEVIEARALDGVDLSDVRLLYNHNADKVPLARTPKTMQLSVTPAGVKMRAALPDTAEARSVYEAVKRGDLSGMSFAFTVPEGGSTFDAATNTRTISRINKVYECSVVAFPAYPETSVEARAQMQNAQAKQKLKIMCNQILKRSFN